MPTGWASEWFKILYISKRNMKSGIPRCKITFCQDLAPCSAPICSDRNPASVNQRKCLPALQTICYFWHTLALFYLLDLILWAHRWTLGCCPTQPLPALLSHCRPKYQVCPASTTSLVPIFAYQETSQYSSQQNLLLQALPLAVPPLSPSASSLHGPQPAVCHPLPEAKPSHHAKCLAVTTQPPTRLWSVQIQPLLHCLDQKWKGAGWDAYSEAVQNTFKKLLHWTTSGSTRKRIE